MICLPIQASTVSRRLALSQHGLAQDGLRRSNVSRGGESPLIRFTHFRSGESTSKAILENIRPSGSFGFTDGDPRLPAASASLYIA
jgi:hypothetical protein